MDKAAPAVRTFGAGIGIFLAFLGFAGWLLALAVVAYGLIAIWNPRHDLSSLPIIAVTLGALGTLGLTLGWRLVKGLPVHVPFTRRVLGVVLLLFAAIVYTASRQDSDLPVWPAAILGLGGLGSLLTWKKKSDALSSTDAGVASQKSRP